MEAIRLHVTGDHWSGRVIVVTAIGLLLCALALGIALLGVQVLTIGGAGTALGSFDMHTPAPRPGPEVPGLFEAGSAHQLLSGPEEISAAYRSRC
jgi:hypothetical protein